MYSVFFLVPKKTGNWQGILDLKWLYPFLVRKRFKMEVDGH